MNYDRCYSVDCYATQEKGGKIKASKDLLCFAQILINDFTSSLPNGTKTFLVPMDAKYDKQSKDHKQGKRGSVSNWLISEPSVFLPAAVQQSRFHHVPSCLLVVVP